MVLFWILFSLYCVVGAALIPTFVKMSYHQALEYKNKKWPGLATGNEIEARHSAPGAGFSKALVWPIFFLLFLGTRSLNQEIKRKQKKEHEEQETARILREYKENDPVEIEFKKLEAEAKIERSKVHRERALEAERKMVLGMRPDAKGVWDYPSHPNDEYEEVRNVSGDVCVRYKTTSGYARGGIIKNNFKFDEIMFDIAMLQGKVDTARTMYDQGLITLDQCLMVTDLVVEELNYLKGQIDAKDNY